MAEIATSGMRAKFNAWKSPHVCRDLGNSSLKKISLILNLASSFWRAAARRIVWVV